MRCGGLQLHKELQLSQFIPFPDEIFNKDMRYKDYVFELKALPRLREFWISLWIKAGGKPR